MRTLPREALATQNNLEAHRRALVLALLVGIVMRRIWWRFQRWLFGGH